MKDILECWWKLFYKIAAVIISALGVISFLFPLESVSNENIWNRVGILIIFFVVCVILAIIITGIKITANKKVIAVSKGEKLSFEYNDIFEILKNEDQGLKYTIVVPINTDLNIVGNTEILEGTIHGNCLKYIHEQSSKRISSDFLFNLQIKKDGIDTTNCKGKKGDWFLITPEDLKYDKKVSFLLIETGDVIVEHGERKLVELEREIYLSCLQTVFRVISGSRSTGPVVYIPLIGAGQANIGTDKDVMYMFHSLLRLNKGKLRKDVRIFIDKRRKKDTPIYRLEKII